MRLILTAFISFLHFSFDTKKKRKKRQMWLHCTERSRKSGGIVGLMKRDAYIRLLETVLNRGAGCVLQAGVSGSADVS